MRAVVSDGANAAPGDVTTVARDMRPLFEPRSVVVIGASASGAITPGNRVLNYLRERGYAGRVRAVHPKASEIGGYPAVPSIEALAGEKIDLACVAVSASACPEVVSRLGAIGVRAAVVLSSGFSEMGNAKLELELADAARRSGMLLCGPNSIGVMSPGQHVHVCFSQAQDVKSAHSGNIALVTQSGALGGSLAAQAWQRGIGISRFVNVGNQALLTSADYLDYLAEDPATRTVALLLEGVTNGAALVRAVERLRSAGKSLVVLKVGRSAEGAKAVQSHTGSIAGDYAVYRAVLARAGATLVDSITEMLDVLQLKHAGVCVPRGTRIAIVSTSGGACAVVADACKRHGFPVPELSTGLRARLAEVLPGFASTINPIDVTGQVVTEPAIYGRALELVLRSDEIDAVTVMLTTIGGSQAQMIASEVVKHVTGQRKPVWVCWTMPSELAEEGIGVFAKHNIPVFDDPARAIGAAALSEAAHHE
jgi:acyl-CoA synthetase (NDP forming)